MTVFRNNGEWDSSNVEFQGGLILAYDKVTRTERMRHIDYGLGVFDVRAFDVVPETGSSDLAKVYQEMLDCAELTGFEVRERFYEIGSVVGLEETRTHLAARA